MRRRRTRLALWEAGNTLCPICLMEFSKQDATARNGRASIEHVPPLKAGKPHLRVLTCKNCNGTGGAWIDHATVELTKQEHAVDLHTEARVYHMRAGLNRPAQAERLIEISHPAISHSIYMWPARNQQLPSLVHQKMRLTWKQRRKPEIGLLKIAYLAVFSLVGAGFAKAKALERVRAQIMRPDEELFRDFCFVLGEDVGRAVYIVYAEGRTCWGVAIDGHLVCLPSVDADEWKPMLDDLRRSSALKKFTHTFGADRRYLFQEIHRVPVKSLTDDVRQGLRQVGSLGWDMRVQHGNRIVGNYVSVGRDQESLWFLEHHQ